MEWKTEKKLRTKNIQKQLLNKADACAIINLKSRVNKLEIDENCIKKKKFQTFVPSHNFEGQNQSQHA